jgi:hypothetical protein
MTGIAKHCRNVSARVGNRCFGESRPVDSAPLELIAEAEASVTLLDRRPRDTATIVTRPTNGTKSAPAVKGCRPGISA